MVCFDHFDATRILNDSKFRIRTCSYGKNTRYQVICYFIYQLFINSNCLIVAGCLFLICLKLPEICITLFRYHPVIPTIHHRDRNRSLEHSSYWKDNSSDMIYMHFNVKLNEIKLKTQNGWESCRLFEIRCISLYGLIAV